jgi:D-tyrosyl-tRNA(Tyr) deacylase
MLGLIQLVSHANVMVANEPIGAINQGILALVGIEKTDTEQQAEKLFDKIMNYRIFKDDQGKMNLSVKNIQGGLLLVPQFTLVADTQKGTRPGFSTGMAPEKGKFLFDYLVKHAKNNYSPIAAGQFGADMKVNLCNDGPVTFILRV